MNLSRSHVYRWLIAGAFMIALAWASWTSGRAGVSRLLSERYASQSSVERAVKLSPYDPQSHSARAVLLEVEGKAAEAGDAFEEAVRLRPGDYYLWARLGYARDVSEDAARALAAYSRAAELAPHYAQPRFYLGHLLARQQRVDEAFKHLCAAAESDPNLIPQVLEVAWWAYDENPAAMQMAMRDLGPQLALALFRFLLKKGNPEAAMQALKGADISEEDRRQLTSELLRAKRFEEAYDLWSGGSDHAGSIRAKGVINDSSFEWISSLDKQMFDWYAPKIDHASVSIDQSAAREGSRSLRIDWNGNSNPKHSVISQPVIVEPGRSYTLRFYSKAQDLVTGGVPVVTVRDGVSGKLLAESTPLSPGTSEWREHQMDFQTNAVAVVIAVTRKPCPQSSCPVFGTLWLDDFSIVGR